MADTRILVTPLRTNFGAKYEVEARKESSGELIATAKQVAMEHQISVVEETQYSSAGDVIYRGKLFFGPGGDLVNEQAIEGQKRWELFRRWVL